MTPTKLEMLNVIPVIQSAPSTPNSDNTLTTKIETGTAYSPNSFGLGCVRVFCFPVDFLTAVEETITGRQFITQNLRSR